MKIRRLGMLLVCISGVFAFAAMPIPQSSNEPAATLLHVYGPGGPLPAMKEAAAAFEKKTHVQVIVTGGPTVEWIADARQNGGVIFSGSEEMMSDFAAAMQGALDSTTITPLYMRKAAILVRPGNPMHIHSLEDLMKPPHHILVVNGAGQRGLWEDVAGRKGDIESVADQVSIDESHQIYRDCGVALTTKGKARPEGVKFICFLQSPEGEGIFEKWGWSK
jgi:accessory colonization factor AcfC